MSNDEQEIRFGLAISDNKSLTDGVLDRYAELENIRAKERDAYKKEIDILREENQRYKQAYFDQWYNNNEIEKCWAVIGNYNKQHLELHEAFREYIRNREWVYSEDVHFRVNIKDKCTCTKSGYEGFPCIVHQ